MVLPQKFLRGAEISAWEKNFFFQNRLSNPQLEGILQKSITKDCRSAQSLCKIGKSAQSEIIKGKPPLKWKQFVPCMYFENEIRPFPTSIDIIKNSFYGSIHSPKKVILKLL